MGLWCVVNTALHGKPGTGIMACESILGFWKGSVTGMRANLLQWESSDTSDSPRIRAVCGNVARRGTAQCQCAPQALPYTRSAVAEKVREKGASDIILQNLWISFYLQVVCSYISLTTNITITFILIVNFSYLFLGSFIYIYSFCSIPAALRGLYPCLLNVHV